MTPVFEMPFRLSESERISHLWERLTVRWEKRLAKLHVELEQNITESESAVIRGHIRALREQLALNKELLPGLAAQ